MSATINSHLQAESDVAIIRTTFRMRKGPTGKRLPAGPELIVAPKLYTAARRPASYRFFRLARRRWYFLSSASISFFGTPINRFVNSVNRSNGVAGFGGVASLFGMRRSPSLVIDYLWPDCG